MTKTNKQLNTSKSPVKTEESKSVIDPKDLEERVERVKEGFKNFYSLESDDDLIKKFIENAKNKNNAEGVGEILLYRFGLDNGFILSSIETDKKSKGLLETRRQLIEEYKCTTPTELMLIDRIVSGYWKSMRLERLSRLILEKDGGDTLSYDQLKINLLKEMQKGIEQADRQFTANLTLLKDIKSPKLNVRIKAENAYIGDKQQIINGDQVNNADKAKSSEPNNLGEKI